ncbi:MAG: hypothetical protein GXY77_19805 [Fibrobacter sp.]|nr:hypothetical protein [Fibrobacter sp.]
MAIFTGKLHADNDDITGNIVTRFQVESVFHYEEIFMSKWFKREWHSKG